MLEVPYEEADAMRRDMMDATNGRVQFEIIEEIYFVSR